MPKPAVLMARDERSDLLDFLRTLTPEQWNAPSLCRGWSVKDVAAHMISYDDLGIVGMTKRLVKGRLIWANEAGVEEYRHLSATELLETFEQRLTPAGLTAGLGGMIGLVDGTIHHQDIRRALDQPRTIPSERLATVIAAVPSNPRLGAHKRIKGLRLVATDLDWAHGQGQEVRGPAEAIMMAISGRADALSDLAGAGHSTLAARVEIDAAKHDQ
ncbi:hypothetical protein GOPIP_093_00130 [Gordonia polyisoprenivorans NBRC 16320 = JCM 10675]|uniref:Maleylpyruvate isomerase family mycothiol-dependent enzyme n=1 Tax=Gordonia polyisoprenivorans TaxID=84595 RepID=A0A846WU24_9ACTN|nr:maleylpyruvate isomerase family mycothiol-dependent enzyme [Gordonia polyisoprenivorans]MBE7192043.1 maleylpyruvate isomerase family mycothiol-dependent enzyme [Gordonia polyisoprenivorans]NKY05134.1 maleylpyruvate isomerase family mycothiol-dependent enzyme [Gordonia polyisoprenivorans]OZC30637.1 maleylpyruvate isomerase family mycothiol-dependent enzyme [Gordonia polyisoprenivorans]QUD84959.1 maleylpyruvate isomerase family mycothiol-dependent enzyme [Gordonia polyisoprenivorans]UZF53878.